MNKWKTYKYSPKSARKSKKTAIVPLALFVVFIIFIFLSYFGVTEFIKNLDKIGIKQQKAEGKTRIANIQPPLLSNIPRYTKIDTIDIEGFSVEQTTILLFKNGQKIDEKETDEEGNFIFKGVKLDKDNNDFYAISKIEDKSSVPSSKLEITLDNDSPNLSITSPSEKSEISVNEGSEVVTVEGVSDPGVEVTVNDRIASLDGEGNFTVQITVEKGDNKLKAVATDQAGNKTEIEFEFSAEIVKVN